MWSDTAEELTKRLMRAEQTEGTMAFRKISLASHRAIEQGGKTLLDCGCGVGELIARTRSHFDILVGIDLDKRMANFCKTRFKRFPSIHILLGDLRYVENLLTLDIDVCTILDVLEHLENPVDFLSQVYDLLKKSGLIIVTTPNWYDKLRWFMFGKKIRSRWLPWDSHRSFHSYIGWRKVVSDAGFHVIEGRSIGFPVLDLKAFAEHLPTLGAGVMIVAQKK